MSMNNGLSSIFKESNTNHRSSRSGIIIFVVLGGIFVLTILVLSYNHLVRGKFNEHREILNHVRGMKVAQSLARYVIDQLKSDLSEPLTGDTNQPGMVLRAKVFQESSINKLSDSLNDLWLNAGAKRSEIKDLVKRLMDIYPMKDVSVNVKISFADVTSLKDLKKGNEFFLDFEKAGKMIVESEVSIGRSVERWKEIRPFRVIVPYPMPITKFTVYVKNATTDHDPERFNTVMIESASAGVAPNSPRPIILYNGSAGGNYNKENSDIWKERGWIYLGGSDVFLNRAAGDKEYGQRYHSYYQPSDFPIPLLLQFNDFTSEKVGTKDLEIKVSRWGFSNSYISGSFADFWKKILYSSQKEHPPKSEKKWWGSTCLHLFGNSKTDRSITRVCGKVYDRFVDIGYLFPKGGGESPIGAINGLSEKDFEKYSGKKRNWFPTKLKDISKFAQKDTWVDPNLVCVAAPVQQRLGVPDLQCMETFFHNMPYSAPLMSLSYNKIMSKTQYCLYDETYKMISQYEKNPQDISIPPKGFIPATTDYNFYSSIFGREIKELKIDKIADNPSFGMEKRVCYEVDCQGDNAFDIVKEAFCGRNNNSFDLKNAVVRIKTSGTGFKFGNKLGTKTGGTFLVDSGIEIGKFATVPSETEAPVVFIAERGKITVNNSGSQPALGYFIAMDPVNGEVKPTHENRPFKLTGGIAANSFTPELFKAGGEITYNQALDPTSLAFAKNLGIVIGPSGGD